MQLLNKMTILRAFYRHCRNLFSCFLQFTSVIHIFDQISSETDMSDLWHSRIFGKREITFMWPHFKRNWYFRPLAFWDIAQERSDWLLMMVFHFKYVAYLMLNILERQRSDISVFLEIWSHICIKLVYWKKKLANSWVANQMTVNLSFCCFVT